MLNSVNKSQIYQSVEGELLRYRKKWQDLEASRKKTNEYAEQILTAIQCDDIDVAALKEQINSWVHRISHENKDKGIGISFNHSVLPHQLAPIDENKTESLEEDSDD